MAKSFECPYCNRPTTLGYDDWDVTFHVPRPTGNDTNVVGIRIETVVCPNTACKKTTLSAALYEAFRDNQIWKAKGKPILHWPLMPRSRAKQYEDFVPQAIREDYSEAHLVLNDSPKASATLARRALQGIMRDFYSAIGKNLKSEIDWVENNASIDPVVVKPLHAVRDVGNIGAHMEHDINLIVPVEPGEAEALLQLIELMIDETYVARKHREDRVNAVLGIAADKKALKGTPATKARPPSSPP